MSERRAVLAQAAIGSKNWEAAAEHAEAALRGGYLPALQLKAAIAYKRKDYAGAIAALEAVEGADGAVLALLIRLHLLAGDPNRAWKLLSDSCRSGVFGPALYPLPHWGGEPVEGRRIVAWGAGYGDDMLFARFLPALVGTGAEVFVNCLPALVRLYRTLPGIVKANVLPLDIEVPDADFQVQTAMLPAFFGDQVWSGPYLSAEPVSRGGSGKRVGLVWASDGRHWESEDRSATLAEMAPLAAVPGVRLFSLQVGPQAAQASPAPAGMQIEDLGSGFDDFADTAAAIAAMDLVISVDTAVANLAGAMGVPVWVAASFISDWRWGQEGDHTPWYPTAKVYRQPSAGDWRSVFHAMAADLTRLLALW